MGNKPRIGITIGDPAGIGPEVSLKAVANAEVLAACVPVLIGDAQYLLRWARAFNLEQNFEVVNIGQPLPNNPSSPVIYNLANIPDSIEMGQEQASCGKCAAEFIETANAHN